jgi:hydroxymethylglutaryl-CoA lyase
MTAPQVTITEVVLRDGFQDEPVFVPVPDRIAVAEALVAAGVTSIEAASFVNPRRVPQMAGAEELVAALPSAPGVRYSAIALNAKGVERAVAAGVTDIGLVTSASQAHSRANAGRTVDDALADLGGVVAAHPDVTFIGGISTAFVCPFEGEIPPETLLAVARSFAAIGVAQIGLADTVGTATPYQVARALDLLRAELPEADFRLHLHNAHGQALQSIDAAFERGITRFDSAAGGYGGCPYAPGAHGNIATEELVAHLHAAGVSTGIDEAALAEAVALVKDVLARAEPLT